MTQEMMIQWAIYAAIAVGGWFARHYGVMAPGGSKPSPPGGAPSPAGIDTSGILALIEKRIEERLARLNVTPAIPNASAADDLNAKLVELAHRLLDKPTPMPAASPSMPTPAMNGTK